MRTTTTRTAGTTLEVKVVLSDAQYLWLRGSAADDTPPASTSRALGRLIDQAIAEERNQATRRAAQLEVYAASGYAEHHPDYPDRLSDPSDV